MIRCPECGARMVLRETAKFRYPNSGSPRRFYGCSNYPECKATHGAHPDGRPLGVPGDAATKQARIRAHNAFFLYCEKHGLSRGEGYEWLQKSLGMAANECHIGRFDAETCEIVVGLCEQGRAV